jgi:hypothetical protein
MIVSELKHVVRIGPTTQFVITQARQTGLNGKMHTGAHTGHIAIDAPDFDTGKEMRQIKERKIIFLFIICNFSI